MFNTKKISYRQALKRIEFLEEQVKDLTFLTENQNERIKELKEDIEKLIENDGNNNWNKVIPNPDDKEAWNKYWQEHMTVSLVKPSDLEH
jgi:hypothetical protein